MRKSLIKNKNTTLKSSFYCILIIFIFINCSIPSNKTKDWKNKTIHFPDSLEMYNNNSYPSPDYKLLVFFNGGCSICIAGLKEWNNILRNNLSGFNIAPIFVALNSDKEILQYNLNNMKFEYNVLIESDSIFYKANPHFRFNDNEFYLLTQDNKTLLKGNTRPEITIGKYLIDPSKVQ